MSIIPIPNHDGWNQLLDDGIVDRRDHQLVVFSRPHKIRRIGTAAVVAFGSAQPPNYETDHWFQDGAVITAKVEAWIGENELPPWQEWDDDILTLFRLSF